MPKYFKDYTDIKESDFLINNSLKELLENRESASIDDFEDEEVKEYIKSIKQYPKLSSREVFTLTMDYHNGSKEAFERLVNCNLYLVIDIVKDYTNLGIDMMDLIQEGNIGLIEGITTYKPEIDYFYSSFYYKVVRYHILRYLENKSRLIRITNKPFQTFVRVFRYKEKQKMFGRDITDGVACKELGLNYSNFKRYFKTYAFISDIVSLDLELDDDTSIQDVLIDHSVSFEEDFEASDTKDFLISELHKILTEREFKIIYLRYGFITGKKETYDAIGKEFCITRLRVQQIELKVLRKLRKHGKCLQYCLD